MSKSRLYAVLTRTAFLEYVRNPLAGAFTLGMPILFMVVFSVANAVSAPRVLAGRSLQIAFVDEAKSTASASLRAALDAFRSARLSVLDAPAAAKAYREDEVQAIIRVPSQQQDAESIARLDVDLRPYSAATVRDALASAAMALALPDKGTRQRTRFEQIATFTETAPSLPSFLQFTITGLIGFSLLNLGLYGTAAPLLTSKQTGAFRHYGLTPMPKGILILAHVTVRVVMALIQVVLLTCAAMLFADLKVVQPLWLLTATLLGAAALVSLGYLVGGAIKSLGLGIAIVFALNFYTLLFGQTFADLRGVPVLQSMIYLNPLTYASDLFRHAFIGPADCLLPAPIDAVALIGWTLAFSALSLRTFTFEYRGR